MQGENFTRPKIKSPKSSVVALLAGREEGRRSPRSLPHTPDLSLTTSLGEESGHSVHDSDSVSQKTASQEVCSTSTILASPLKGLSPAPPPLSLHSSPSLHSVEEEVEEAISVLPSEEEGAKYSSSFEHQTREEEARSSSLEKSSSCRVRTSEEPAASGRQFSPRTVDRLTEAIWRQLLVETSRDLREPVTQRRQQPTPPPAKSPRKSHTRSKSVSLKPQDLMLTTFDLTSSSDDSSPYRKVSSEGSKEPESDQESAKHPEDEEEFIDDDFGLSAIRQEAEILRLQQLKVEEEIARIAQEAEAASRAVPDRPPPPYIPPSLTPPVKQPPPPAPRVVVPATREEVERAVAVYTEVLWACRERGEVVEAVKFSPSWVQGPPDLAQEEAAALEQYHRMLWQVTVEKVTGLYSHETLQQNPPWMAPLPLGKLKYQAPKTLDQLRLIELEVVNMLLSVQDPGGPRGVC